MCTPQWLAPGLTHHNKGVSVQGQAEAWPPGIIGISGDGVSRDGATCML